MKIYSSENVYLCAFLVSQDNFKLGKVYMDPEKVGAKDAKATIEIEYDEKYEPMLGQFVELYKEKKAVCRLNAYQDNIRFIMHLINTRKSGINDDFVKRPTCQKDQPK